MTAAAALLKRTAVPEECGAAGGQPALKSISEGPAAAQILSPACLLEYSQLAISLTLATGLQCAVEIETRVKMHQGI